MAVDWLLVLAVIIKIIKHYLLSITGTRLIGLMVWDCKFLSLLVECFFSQSFCCVWLLGKKRKRKEREKEKEKVTEGTVVFPCIATAYLVTCFLVLLSINSY